MIRRIASLVVLPGLKLRVRFDDGRVVAYDVGEDVRDIPAFAPLADEPALFFSVQLDESRTCAYWNEDIDLPSDAIYEYGRELVPAI